MDRYNIKHRSKPSEIDDDFWRSLKSQETATRSAILWASNDYDFYQQVKHKIKSLLKYHPDFNEIREQDEFHEWAEEQPKWVQDALYENYTDAKAASRVIEL